MVAGLQDILFSSIGSELPAEAGMALVESKRCFASLCCEVGGAYCSLKGGKREQRCCKQ